MCAFFLILQIKKVHLIQMNYLSVTLGNDDFVFRRIITNDELQFS